MKISVRWQCPSLIFIVFGSCLAAHAQIGGANQGLAQTLSQHGPNAAQIIAAHDQNVPDDAAARERRARRRREDVFKHLQHDTQVLEQAVTQLSAELNTPAGARPTEAQAQLAVKEAERIQKLAGDINKRMSQ